MNSLSHNAGKDANILYLCCGQQSSGSTLVSWCFLQRDDMDGVLDCQYDFLPETHYFLPWLDTLQDPRLRWYKHTIASFRATEVKAYLEDAGRLVVPLLVVRDVETVWRSLIRKSYGRNSTTAEDPPLRTRFRRFLEDWEYHRDQGLPILRFESFLSEPEKTLRTACESMGLTWNSAMLDWPKPESSIMDCRFGNLTFHKSRGTNLRETLTLKTGAPQTTHISEEDRAWLGEVFTEYNRAHGYTCKPTESEDVSAATPDFRLSRRHRWLWPYYSTKRIKWLAKRPRTLR